jgi:hypothetical protein
MQILKQNKNSNKKDVLSTVMHSFHSKTQEVNIVLTTFDFKICFVLIIDIVTHFYTKMAFDQDLKSKNQNCTKMCKSLSVLLRLLMLLELIGMAVSSEMCTRHQENAIVASYPCKTRDVLIDLNPYVANLTEVIQIIPDKATISKCGGYCLSKSKPCTSTGKKMKTIPVIMIMEELDNDGNHVKQCGQILVEEDANCSCHCPIREGMQMLTVIF